MGLLSFGTGKERKMQLMLYDDDSFEFVKRELENSCLVEKRDGVVVRGWKHFFSNQVSFNGYGNIHAGMVTISCLRDFILDPFNKIPETATPDAGGKPRLGGGQGILKWTARIAESMRFSVVNNRGKGLIGDKITYALIVALLMLLLIFGLKMSLHW